jgi:hypothetical protein
MPTVLRLEGYRFFFYSDELNEPPHIHVTSGGKSAKLWLDPVELARTTGYTMVEVNRIWRMVAAHADLLKERWDEFHGTDRR